MEKYRYVLGLRPKDWAWFGPLLGVILLLILAGWLLSDLILDWAKFA